MGIGLIETWEYQEVPNLINSAIDKEKLQIKDLNDILKTSKSIVEWSTSMVKANYQDVVDAYTEL